MNEPSSPKLAFRQAAWPQVPAGVSADGNFDWGRRMPAMSLPSAIDFRHKDFVRLADWSRRMNVHLAAQNVFAVVEKQLAVVQADEDYAGNFRKAVADPRTSVRSLTLG